MPRRVFKHLNRRRHDWKARPILRPFRLLLENPAYWSLNRRNVARAFAVGLFIGYIPLPLQGLLAIVFAALLRLNIPAAVAGTALVNPFTMMPIYLFSYWVGCKLLGMDATPVAFEISWEWLAQNLLPIWKPFLLGCLVMALLTSLGGYLLLSGAWHVSLVMKYHKRKLNSSAKESANGRKWDGER
jgi:uncharacterized protein (DUF2062 family)